MDGSITVCRGDTAPLRSRSGGMRAIATAALAGAAAADDGVVAVRVVPMELFRVGITVTVDRLLLMPWRRRRVAVAVRSAAASAAPPGAVVVVDVVERWRAP
jgi:hypothetical protein